ncbi:hypothetical protein IKF84_00370 [Candidatus Saccharibacteria bacterium]|nr:hypothetical protein [Candidatus Saccharibacteria bacterium]
MRNEDTFKIVALFVAFAVVLAVAGVLLLRVVEPKTENAPIAATPPQFEAGDAAVDWDSEPTAKPAKPPVEELEETAEEAAATEAVTVEEKVIPTEESEEPQEEAVEKDPYGIFIADEDWIRQTNGYAVERNGKLYALDALMPSTVITEYDCGYQIGEYFIESMDTNLYLYDQREISDVPTGATDAVISIGDFPIYYVDSGEELRVYSDRTLEEVKIKRAEFYGYTIPATGRQMTYFPILDHLYGGLDDNITDPTVLKADGTPVEDVRKLNYGEQYTFEWYEGMDYHSQTFEATSRCYVVDDDNLSIKVPVKKTKEGYGIVDLSEVEPGNCYTISNVLGVFELR